MGDDAADGDTTRGAGRPIPQSPQRSALLARVRRKRTAPEEIVAALLRARGLAYRRNARDLPGSPDFANRRKGWAIFVNGCFWHRHTGCRRATLPKNNRAFWSAKFAANRRRDAAAIRRLRALGFRVLVIWECEVAVCGERLDRLAASAPRRTRRPTTRTVSRTIRGAVTVGTGSRRRPPDRSV